MLKPDFESDLCTVSQMSQFSSVNDSPEPTSISKSDLVIQTRLGRVAFTDMPSVVIHCRRDAAFTDLNRRKQIKQNDEF